MKYLFKTTNIYRVDTQEEVDELIGDVNEENFYTKEDGHYYVAVNRVFNDIDYPTYDVEVTYRSHN